MQSGDLQFVDNVLADRSPRAFGTGATRRQFLMGAAAAGAGIGIWGLLGGFPAQVFAHGLVPADPTQAILNIADTAERLAVTYLGYVIDKSNLPASVKATLAAARYEEQVHAQTLEAVGAKPLTSTFSLPAGNLSYVTDGTKALQTIEAAEGLFVAAYLAAVAEFALRSNWKWAQYSAEIMGVEAEHRVLARAALGQTPPNNLVFEAASQPSVGAAAKTLAGLGFLSPSGANAYAYPGPGDINAGAAGVGATSLTSSIPATGRVPTALPDTGAGGLARRASALNDLGLALAGGAAAVAGGVALHASRSKSGA